MLCPYCEKYPGSIPEYVEAAKQQNMTPEQFVQAEEGTYHPATQLFCCTDCYIRIGMPLNEKLFEIFELYRLQYPDGKY